MLIGEIEYKSYVMKCQIYCVVQLNTSFAQHYVITIFSDLRQIGDFLQVLRFPPPINLTAAIYS
jgi:hypothetical protein